MCGFGIPLNRPLRRGGNIVLGDTVKCWVDYKYERLPGLCHYCGMLDHRPVNGPNDTVMCLPNDTSKESPNLPYEVSR